MIVNKLYGGVIISKKYLNDDSDDVELQEKVKLGVGMVVHCPTQKERDRIAKIIDERFNSKIKALYYNYSVICNNEDFCYYIRNNIFWEYDNKTFYESMQYKVIKSKYVY